MNYLTLSQTVAAEIEQRIINGDLASGDRLPTVAELSVTLRVSASVVRDALQILYVKGHVESKRGAGIRVNDLGIEAAVEFHKTNLLRTRLPLGEAIRLLAQYERLLVDELRNGLSGRVPEVSSLRSSSENPEMTVLQYISRLGQELFVHGGAHIAVTTLAIVCSLVQIIDDAFTMDQRFFTHSSDFYAQLVKMTARGDSEQYEKLFQSRSEFLSQLVQSTA